ncbi:Uma2 family endonuclease [Microcoleus sp. EPA2]|uniref:Uma2 family endonuclease n=1 Tax=Microcoleus sp. EPA2 TaxID=2841654 RepID=UPI00312B350E
MVITQTNPPNLTDATKTSFTLDEYRAIEETAEERHEYCNGEIIAMSGGSPAHSRIAVDTTTFLNVALRDTNFQTYNGDLRIWIPSFNHGTYPDVMVIDGEPEFNGSRTDEILNPLLIVEILSPSTEAYDRGEKFRKYRSIASFCEYLLVSQTEPYIEQYHNLDRQTSDRWQWQVYDGIDRAIVLHSLNIELPMSEVYRRLNF